MSKLIQDLSIGKNIKNLRKQNKMTQVDLCTKMQLYGSSLSVTSLAKIEGGYRNIKISDLVILKSIFDVTYDKFFKDLNINL